MVPWKKIIVKLLVLLFISILLKFLFRSFIYILFRKINNLLKMNTRSIDIQRNIFKNQIPTKFMSLARIYSRLSPKMGPYGEYFLPMTFNGRTKT